MISQALPVLSWHQFGATDLAAVPIAMIVGAGLLYLFGVRRIRQLDPTHPWSTRRTAAFMGGLIVTFLAVQSFVGLYDAVLFYDHMIQHLMLIMIAAPLFAMGAPVELLERSTTGRSHDVVARGLHSRAAGFIAHPIVDFALYAVLIPFAHLTGFYNLTLQHESLHDAEHLAFVVIGYLFWRHVVAIEPTRHPLHPGVRLLYLALAVPVDTFTGLALVSASSELFSAYAQLHRAWGPSLVSDLHIGGAVMWVGGDTLMLLAMIPVAIQWLHEDERRAQVFDSQIDQELAREMTSNYGPR